MLLRSSDCWLSTIYLNCESLAPWHSLRDPNFLIPTLDPLLNQHNKNKQFRSQLLLNCIFLFLNGHLSAIF